MERWLRILSKIDYYHHPVIGAVGLAYTLAFHEPGIHRIGVGPVSLDAFYVTVVAFSVLLLLSLVDSYDPDDYRVELPDSDE
ncbi:hypothetical protein ACFQDG_04895 [Natronoarchaeum mannanilyticum]|uniref:Uncharacterized protein n=1 Tax=Natronoarchaeum mannanilyticum TaxID=926360 RepID=A0AAV3T5W0_9EURY